MKIERDYDLTARNTFGVPARAKFFAEVTSEAEAAELFRAPEFRENKKLFLGGGSNVLFTRDWDGMVIWNKLPGIQVVREDAEKVLVRAAAGEIWHDLVQFAVERGLWGVENLALIPGTVGAAPMQNIGAYGAELKNVLESVEAIEIKTGAKKIFKTGELNLGYRDSIFKRELKDQYFITAITLILSKIPAPQLHYKHLREYIESKKLKVESSKDISEAVAEIRKSKLPNPAVIPNAGSFFKNVFVDPEKLAELKKDYPEMPTFAEDHRTKIPAAWFIEETNWKGKRLGNAGVHEKQALVLVNHGGATGAEIKALADQIIASVRQKFGITLVPEVNLI